MSEKNDELHSGSLSTSLNAGIQAAADKVRQQANELGLGQLDGTRQADLARANPYSVSLYSPSVWDKIGDFFGFHTAQDKYEMQRRQAEMEYYAQLTQTASEEAYNSDPAKAARMRAAGQNPDLLGTANASEASEFDQEQTSPDIASLPIGDAEQALKPIMMLGGVFQSAIASGFGIMDKLVDINGKIFTNEGIELKNWIDSFSNAKTLFQSGVGANPESPANLFTMLEGAFKGLSGRNKSRMTEALRTIITGGEGQSYQYELGDRFLSSRFNYQFKANQQLYKDFNTGMSEIQQAMIDGVEKALAIQARLNYETKELEEAQIAVQQGEAKYGANYWKLVETEDENGKKLSDIDADTAKAVSRLKNIQAKVDKTKQEIDQLFLDTQYKMLEPLKKGRIGISMFNPAAMAGLEMATQLMKYGVNSQLPSFGEQFQRGMQTGMAGLGAVRGSSLMPSMHYGENHSYNYGSGVHR